jgi:apoptosis-inducing factor 3
MGGQVEAKGPDFAKEGFARSEIADGAIVAGQAHGEPVLLVRRGEQCFAIGAACTHYGAPLADGIVEGNSIRCPYHHARFDLATGEATAPPALGAIPCYQVEQRGERLYVLGRSNGSEAAPGGNPRRTAQTAPKNIAIVGGGPAGAACAEMLRREGYDGAITLFAPETSSPVDRPNLSKDYLAGNAPEEWLPVRGPEFFAEHHIELRRERLDKLDPKYDATLLATGALPVRLPIPGAERALLLRTLDDSRAIIERARGRVVVIGASFIGLEVAAALNTRGVEVHVIGREAMPLERVLGPVLGELVRSVHAKRGVHFHLEASPTSIDDKGVVVNGEHLAADLVVMGVGVQPDLALAQQTGVAIDRGVVVDAQMRTSVPGIWAAGDIARFPYAPTGERVRIEHWVVAQQQGQAAARSMLGKGAPFTAIPFFWSAHYDLTINYVGHAESFDSSEVVGNPAERDCAVAYRRDGKTLAVATIGRDIVSLRAEAALERGEEPTLET